MANGLLSLAPVFASNTERMKVDKFQNVKYGKGTLEQWISAKKFKIRYHWKSQSVFFMRTFDHVLKNYIPLTTCGRIHHSLHVCTPILNACVHSTVWFIVIVLAPWLRINSTLLPEVPNMKFIHVRTFITADVFECEFEVTVVELFNRHSYFECLIPGGHILMFVYNWFILRL